jgi:hypothetical protein
MLFCRLRDLKCVLTTLVLARSANDAGASTAAQSGRTKGTALFLPVRPTPHDGLEMRLANDATHLAKLRQNERKRLLLRSQVERKAATYRSVRTQGGGGKGEKSEDTSRSAKGPAVPWNPTFDDFYIALG